MQAPTPPRPSAAITGAGSYSRIVGRPAGLAEFARWLAMPRFGLSDAHFVEGGPEASLMLRDGSHEFRVVGSWPGIRVPTFRDIPNVIGVVGR